MGWFLGVATFLEVGEDYESQPDIVLQMGLQGIAFMHSDLGGFAGKMKTMNCMLVGCNTAFSTQFTDLTLAKMYLANRFTEAKKQKI